MALKKPIVAFIAEGNAEAHAVANLLISEGIEAHLVEDNSGVSLGSLGGGSSPFNRPEVWVEQENLQRAKELVEEYEDNKLARRVQADNLPPIVSTCEKCNAASEFPASQDGSTQNCPKCGAYIDVGEFEWPEEDHAPSDETELPHSPQSEVQDNLDAPPSDDTEDKILFVYAAIVVVVLALGVLLMTSPVRFVVLMMFVGPCAILVAVIFFLVWCFSRGMDEHRASYQDTEEDGDDSPSAIGENPG